MAGSKDLFKEFAYQVDYEKPVIRLEHRGTVVMETPRLIMRPFLEEDAPLMFRNWASDPEVTKYLTWPTHRSEEDSLGYIHFLLDSYQQPDFYNWALVLKETGELIGNISVVTIDEPLSSASLGWVIGRKWWGQGLVPEAGMVLRNFLFDQVGFHRVWAKHDGDNPKSGRVMQKIGLLHEGRLRAAGLNTRGIVDIEIYGLLEEDRK